MTSGNGHRPHKSLRKLLDEQDVIIAPGVWDGISASIGEKIGFDAFLSPGWGVAATMGLADADIYTRTQNALAVKYICQSTTAAVIADIDGGYGNAIGVYYTIQEFEDAGASGVLLEDQSSPKRCTHMVDSLPLEDVETAAGKVRAACDARRNPDMVIIARTDSQGDEIMRRGEAYAEAGADMICPIAPDPSFDADKWAELHERTGLPLVSAFVPGTWQEREFTIDVMKEIGVKIAFLGLHHLYASATAIRDTMQRIKDGEWPTEVFQGDMGHEEFSNIIGLDRIFEMEAHYLGESAHNRVETGSF